MKNLVSIIIWVFWPKKKSKSIGLLYRLKKCVPSEVLRVLYYSLVHPYFIYCIDSWYGTSQSLLQNKSIRAIFDLSYKSYTSHFFNRVIFQKISVLYEQNLACVMFNYINHESLHHNCIPNYISLKSDMHNHYARGWTYLTMPRFSFAGFQTTFTYQAVRVWNSLSNEIKSSDSVNTYKAKLKFPILIFLRFF